MKKNDQNEWDKNVILYKLLVTNNLIALVTNNLIALVTNNLIA